jgi:hypothetical protein
MAVGGGGAVWLALHDLLALAHGLAMQAPLVELSSVDVRGLLVGLGLLVLAPLCRPLAPTPKPTRRHRRAPRKRIDWRALWFGSAFMLVVLGMITPPFAAMAIGRVAMTHGYRLCPDPDDEHRPPMRWATVGSRCPTSWRDAKRMLP